MDQHAKEYMKANKELFDNDGWWGKTGSELAEKIPNNWLRVHTSNDEYWDLLYGDIKKNPGKFKNKVALDFGCGFGGNIKNLSKIAEWKNIYGFDISPSFVEITKEYLTKTGVENFNIYETDGCHLKEVKGRTVDFVTSIVVLQHIALYQVRDKILKEFYRVLKSKGILSFQMNMTSGVDYYTEEVDSFKRRRNCKLESPEQIVKHLVEVGFKEENISYTVGSNPIGGKNDWLYIKAIK